MLNFFAHNTDNPVLMEWALSIINPTVLDYLADNHSVDITVHIHDETTDPRLSIQINRQQKRHGIHCNIYVDEQLIN